VRLYTALVAELNAGHAELARSQAILNKWADEDKKARIGQRAEIARERQAIGGVLSRLRRTQFQLERVHFRLLRLKSYHDRGIGRGTLEGGSSTAQFYEKFSNERKDVERKMALTRSVSKMYVRRSEGALP
jgi:hypothetical protein